MDDPRARRSREAILEAAQALLVEHGPGAVTHAQVAERSGVGRATVYRHWPRTHELLSEVMSRAPFPFFAEPTRPTREWFRTNVAAIADQLQQVEVRAVVTTLINGALWDEGLDARRAAFAHTVSERITSALERAEADGEVTLRVPAPSGAAILLGPVLYRATLEVTAASIEQVIDVSLDALGDWAR